MVPVVGTNLPAAFTYNPELGSDLDKVRLYLQDTVGEHGPKPGDKNFTDDEIAGLISLEGSWQRAVAAGFEILAAAWTRYPSFNADGLSVSRTDIANGFTAQAKTWRLKYGDSAAAKQSRTGSHPSTRVDGYSQTIDSEETA